MKHWEQVFIIVIAVLVALFVGTLVAVACHWRKSTAQASPFALAHDITVQNQAYDVEYSTGSGHGGAGSVADGDLYEAMATPPGTWSFAIEY